MIPWGLSVNPWLNKGMTKSSPEKKIETLFKGNWKRAQGLMLIRDL